MPLAPILSVTLLNPRESDNRTYKLDAILDTGADGTLIPLEAVSTLRLPLQSKRVPVAGVGGAITMGFYCQAKLQLGEISLSPIKVVGCEAAAIGAPG